MKTAAAVLCALFTAAMLPSVPASAENMELDDHSDRIHTVYSSDNGLPCGEANDIVQTEDGSCFVCADNGVGVIDGSGSFHSINTGSFSNSIDNMEIDYQGSLRFTSVNHSPP